MFKNAYNLQTLVHKLCMLLLLLSRFSCFNSEQADKKRKIIVPFTTHYKIPAGPKGNDCV